MRNKIAFVLCAMLALFSSPVAAQAYGAPGGSLPVTVRDGATGSVLGDANGVAVVPAPSATFWRYTALAGGIVSSTADVTIKSASGSSLIRNYLCTIDISHAALAAPIEFVVKDNVTVIWRGLLQTAAVDVSAGAGKITFSPCLRGSQNAGMSVALLTSDPGGVYVNASGFTGL